MKSNKPHTHCSAQATEIASNSTFSTTVREAEGAVVREEGSWWYTIKEVERMQPFLMTLASDSDHWMFLLSNGSLTAGRRNPDKALFPYYTQDKLLDMTGRAGSLTLLRTSSAGERPEVWEPFTGSGEWDGRIHRNLRKSELGNHIILEEIHERDGLVCRISWRPSEKFGFVRKMTLENQGATAQRVQLLDGLTNIMPSGLEQRFQNEFSILGDAYKQSELILPESLGIYHLSSVPTDLAEPMESLQATVVWQKGMEGASFLLSESQLRDFRLTGAVRPETRTRGMRGAFIMVTEVEIPAGEKLEWYICADVGKDTREVKELRAWLKSANRIEEEIEADCRATDERLRRMLASADGIQCTADPARSMRHLSNTLFNLMRGGTFTTGNSLP